MESPYSLDLEKYVNIEIMKNVLNEDNIGKYFTICCLSLNEFIIIDTNIGKTKINNK